MLVFSHVIALAIGFVLDLIVGDPYCLPHPIRWIGIFIAALEKPLRAIFPKSPTGEKWAGFFLVLLVVGISTAVCIALLSLCRLISPWLALAVESIICYQMLATCQLRKESMRVFEALERGTLEDARHAVAMIVGRDTACLSDDEVTRAAVETVAENASDGVVAPLLFMAIGGAPLGVLYKSVNTMDSMVGYKNDQFLYYGRVAAKLDDVLNYIPARISAQLMCLVSGLVGFDSKRARAIYKRDRNKHLSPNSAHTEAACAGALGVQLGGPHLYFGKVVDKPTIGDACREIEHADIIRTNRLMYATAFASLVVGLVVSACMALLTGGIW